MSGDRAPELEKAHKPWTRREAVLARPDLLERARALDALLVAPLGVLPKAEGELVRVFQVGIHEEIAARRRPDVDWETLVKAVRVYVRAFAYRLAMAQPGSVRHDIDGNVVEEVRDTERRLAQDVCRTIIARTKLRRSAQAAAPADHAVIDY